MLVGHRQQCVPELLIVHHIQPRTYRLLFIGFVQWQRNRVVAMSAGRGLHDFFRLPALRVCQLNRDASEVTDALMTANQQVNGVFGFRLRREWGNLIQHVDLLSQERLGPAAESPVETFWSQAPTSSVGSTSRTSFQP